MISREALRELTAISSKNALIVSLYLNVDPRDNPKDKWLLHYKNLAKDAVAELTPTDRAQAQSNLDDIERYFSDKPEGHKRGIAIINSRELNFRKIYNTAVPFTNQLVIEREPFIKPLAAVLDLYQRYLVVIAGRERTRLFISGAGEIEALTEFFKPPEKPDKGRDGSTGDMHLIRAGRAKRETERSLFKETDVVIERVLASEKIERILIGGTSTIRGRLKGQFPPAVLEKVADEFSVDIQAGGREILERCLPVMRSVEERFEQRALNELFGSNSVAALGLSDVLTALQQGNVRKMYVMEQVNAPGMRCRRCGALTPERGRPCPYCGGEMRRIPSMLDYAIGQAIDQGARVDLLEIEPRLEKAGGIGALLRF